MEGREQEFIVLIDDVYTPSQRPVEPQRSTQGWIVFISNLHQDITEDELRDHFADCGKIESIVMPLARRTGLARGYALVEYRERNHAQNAVATLHNSHLMDRLINVTWCFAAKQ